MTTYLQQNIKIRKFFGKVSRVSRMKVEASISHRAREDDTENAVIMYVL